MARKKVVLIIVEGPSDETALGVPLSRVFDSNQVFVHVVHGDITSKDDVTPGNVVKKVYGFVKKTMDRYRLTKANMAQVIHLMDSDGAYAPDELVVGDPLAERVVYAESGIKARNRDSILERNRRKASNMDRLVAASLSGAIGGIPYHAVYMSCNLDHVLYNRLNTDDEEKEANALGFARRFRNDPEGFIAFISCSVFSVVGSCKETWDYLRVGAHSLERHTNLGICLPGGDE